MSEPHVHHWVLQTSNAYQVPARCSCGAERVFTGGHQDMKEAYWKSKGSVFSNPRPPGERIADEVMGKFKQSHWEAM